MSVKRKLVAGGAAILVVAGAATGAAVAASGHGGDAQHARQAPPFRATHAGFVRASAFYLGVDVPTLRHEMKGGRTIADVADATRGKSAAQLTSYLVRAAAARLNVLSHRPLTAHEQRTLHGLLRNRITGFLTDTCPLKLSDLAKHMGGCHGMKME